MIAAAAGATTGVLALSGSSISVVIHGGGGLLALALVGLVAARDPNRSSLSLVAAMGVATLTGAVWTLGEATAAVVVAHVITGVLAAAAVLLSLTADRPARSA